MVDCQSVRSFTNARATLSHVCSRRGSPRGKERCSSDGPWYEERSRRRRKSPDFPAGSRLPGSRDAWFRQPPPVASPVLWCAVARHANKPTHRITERPCCPCRLTRILRTGSVAPLVSKRLVDVSIGVHITDGHDGRPRRRMTIDLLRPDMQQPQHRALPSSFLCLAVLRTRNNQSNKRAVLTRRGVVCAVRARAGRRTYRTAWAISTWRKRECTRSYKIVTTTRRSYLGE
jgi:hypothetical protein